MVSRTGPDFEPLSRSGRDANGRRDICCSTLQELYGRMFRVDRLVGLQLQARTSLRAPFFFMANICF